MLCFVSIDESQVRLMNQCRRLQGISGALGSHFGGRQPAQLAMDCGHDPVIRRGDPVVIEAGSAGFAISREGVALADAQPGARFLVRVDDARQPVQAVAIADGRATLPGWGE